MIANDTLPENLFPLESAIKETKKMMLNEKKFNQLHRSYISVENRIELTKRVPYYTIDRQKVKVYTGQLNTRCRKQLKWQLIHKIDKFLNAGDATDHKTAQDCLTEILEIQGY